MEHDHAGSVGRGVSRRHVLRSAVSGLAVAGLGVPLLAAGCGGDKPSAPSGATDPSTPAQSPTINATPSSGASATPSQAGPQSDLLPTYVPYSAVPTDYPATAEGVVAAYAHYPAPPVPLPSPPVGGGADVTMLAMIQFGPPPALGQNPWWQQINKETGANLKFTVAAPADYSAKLNTSLASGQLPDFTQIVPGDVQRLPEILQAQFQDLTDHLSGDNVKQFPLLANLPPQAWRDTVFNGRIYALPIPRCVLGTSMTVRKDITDSLGLDINISSGEEYLKLCQELTDVKKGRWAQGSPTAALGFVCNMMGAPNGWSESGGKFVHRFETDQARRSIDVVAGQWHDGIFHPDSYAIPGGLWTWLVGGKIVMNNGGFTAFSSLVTGDTSPERLTRSGLMAVPGYDGGAVGAYLSQAAPYLTAIKRTSSPDRLKMLLEIANFIAAPFGTDRYMLLNYGIKGDNYTLDGPDPVRVSQPQLPTYYLSQGPWPLYIPGHPDLVKQGYDFLVKTIPSGVYNAALGLYSAKDAVSGRSIDASVNNVVNDVIQGRKSLKDYDNAVTQWRKAGGDAIRSEYEESFAKAHG